MTPILRALFFICATELGRTNTNSRQTWYLRVSVTCWMTSRRPRRLFQWSENSQEKGGRQTPATQASIKWFQFMNLFPRSLAQMQSIAPCAENLKACMQLTPHRTVASRKKVVSLRNVLEKASLVAQPPITRLPVHLHSSQQRLQSLRRQMRSSRRARKSASIIMIATVMTPTPLEGACLVAHVGATVENLRLLVIHTVRQIYYPLSK